MFEERCIQWLMEHAFTLDRRKPPVRCLSLNLLSLLQGLHLCRQKTKFSTVITDLYSPILWKYLNVISNIFSSRKNFSQFLKLMSSEYFRAVIIFIDVTQPKYLWTFILWRGRGKA